MITLKEVKTFIDMDLSNTNYDTYLNNTIGAVKQAIDNYCGQNIVKANNTFYFEGNGLETVTLKKFPVNEVVSLSERQEPTDNWSVIADTEYTIIEGDINKLYMGNSFSSDYYKLVLDTGYQFDVEEVEGAEVITSTVPQDIRHVAFEMMQWHYDENIEGTLTVASTNISEAGKTVSVTPMKVWKADWRRVLGSYRTYLL